MKQMLCLLLAACLLPAAAGCAAKTDEPELCTYTVYCCGAENGEAVEGVIINFCTDVSCTPVTSAEQGAAVFTGPPASYHVQIVKIPEGWELAQDETEWETEACGEVRRILFREVGQ